MENIAQTKRSLYETQEQARQEEAALVINHEVKRALAKLATKPIDPDDGWYERTLCAFADDPEIFVEPLGRRKGEISPRVERAKRFCEACPVQRECLDDALDAGGSRDGFIYGGLTTDERHALSRRASRARSSSYE